MKNFRKINRLQKRKEILQKQMKGLNRDMKILRKDLKDKKEELEEIEKEIKEELNEGESREESCDESGEEKSCEEEEYRNESCEEELQEKESNEETRIEEIPEVNNMMEDNVEGLKESTRKRKNTEEELITEGEFKERERKRQKRRDEERIEKAMNEIEELKGDDVSENVLEEEISIRNLVELFNEVSMIEEGAKNRNRKAIYKWYKYAKSFGRKMEEEFEKDLEMVERVDSTIRKRIYDEMMGMMKGETEQEIKKIKEKIRKKTTRAEKILKNYEELGEERMKRVGLCVETFSKLSEERLQAFKRKLDEKIKKENINKVWESEDLEMGDATKIMEEVYNISGTTTPLN